MRSYRQYCGLAKALDVVGDRWSLLIVRELLVGPCRYRDLLDGLPGIATNLLAERLRHLEASGVVERDDAGRYALTDRGDALREPVYALGRWAAPLLGERGPDDTFRGHWLVHPLSVLFGERDVRRPTTTIEVRAEGSACTIQCVDGEVTVYPGAPDAPDLVVMGPPDAVLGLLAGRLDRRQAAARGATVLGDGRILRRMRPGAA